MAKEIPLTIDLTSQLRQIMYDVGLGEYRRTAEWLGLPPVSEEGEEAEISASVKRLDKVIAFAPLLSEISTAVAMIVTGVQSNFPELASELEGFIAYLQQVCLLHSTVLLAQLSDLGLIMLHDIRSIERE